MGYAVKEMFLTLQGEGVQAGRRAVFLRFAGCNLWTGREQDRAKAVCQFCDTDFVGVDGENGGRFEDAGSLADAVLRLWGDAGPEERFVVITGGEPMLQLDAPLVDALHARGVTIAVESNGTIAAVPGIDWLCISPKAGSDVVQTRGDELKLVWPQAGIDITELEQWGFANRLIQPMDLGDRAENAEAQAAAIALVMERPAWRLTLQTHKLLGLK
jgi:7-carboxy-7-deazaguanine synthase (Cx14CxxC type)